MSKPELTAFDKRSRKNLFLTDVEWGECREKVAALVEEGYGLEIVPSEALQGRGALLRSFVLLAREMKHRGHEVALLAKRGNASLRNKLTRAVPDLKVIEC